MNESDHRHLHRLIRQFDAAMLVTRSLNGEPRARPMAIAGRDDGAVLYFVSHADDEKVEEIARTPEVAVTMQSSGRFLSITGRARVDADPLRIRTLWKPSMKIWFPEGTDDPELTLIVIEPRYAEFWDRAGLRRLEFWWEAGRALLRGDGLDDDRLGGHAKIRPE